MRKLCAYCAGLGKVNDIPPRLVYGLDNPGDGFAGRVLFKVCVALRGAGPAYGPKFCPQ